MKTGLRTSVRVRNYSREYFTRFAVFGRQRRNQTAVAAHQEGATPVHIRYEWQVAEQVQPTAQRHTDVPDWMAAWDTYSRTALDNMHREYEREVAERAANRSAAA